MKSNTFGLYLLQAYLTNFGEQVFEFQIVLYAYIVF